MEVMSQQCNLHLQEESVQRQAGCLTQTNAPLEAEQDRGEAPGDKKTDLFYNIHSDRCPPACSTS